jgi:hypothetical protein
MNGGSVRLLLAVAAFATLAPASRVAADGTYNTRITQVNRVGLTITNYGFFGNNFNSRSPSFEFPLGSALEHMSRGGLWVGARALSDTGRFTGVSAAIVDNSQGSSGPAETEFTPVGSAFVERSRVPNNAFYSPNAISDQDLTSRYEDVPARLPSGFQTEPHTPLQIGVVQRLLGFSLAAADAFEVAQFTIVNHGPPLANVYVGFYAQLASGNKNAYSGWPPGSNSGPGSWYYKAHIDYDRTRRFYKEHFCELAPYPAACNFAYCPPWAGIKLLSVHPDSVASKTVSFHWWSFSPGDTSRDQDVERYGLMSNGGIDDVSGCVPGGQQCSPIMVLAVGPFAQIDPGDSVRVDFAFIGGETETAFNQHADYAQFASDVDYKLPAPPPSPRLVVEPHASRLDVYWDESPEAVEDPTSAAPGHRDFEGYRVYVGLDRFRPDLVAQFDLTPFPHDTTGFNTGLGAIRLPTPHVVNGVPYHYRYSVTGLRDGLSYYGAVTSYDLGDAQVPSLESGFNQNKFQAVPGPTPEERHGGITVFPNPYRVEAEWDRGALVRDHYLWFANLPEHSTLRIYTLAGDLIFETRFEGGSYRGQGARGLYDPRQDLDTPPPLLSGTNYAWNLITRKGEAVATGLYVFSVEDLDRGTVTRGKFLVVKSDREN